ncbi:MAG: discoidin domain-containing protein [Verrucomicrobia bacterium]|nr:discoidin domain-containing protein [Verrucomicrobiota bacterium]
MLPLIARSAAADEGWDERLAQMFSGRMKEIDQELSELAPQIANLPSIPIDDQGGTGGFASIHSAAVPTRDSRFSVEIRWPASAKVDQVALVPARRYNAQGLDPQYGLPDSFTVELIDEGGRKVSLVAKETGVGKNPMRRGHPFVYQVSPPVVAAGVRISADLLKPDLDSEDAFVHAWAEVFVFDGERNVARGGEVRSLSGSAPSAPWHWNNAFLVDGQTPLGFPEKPAGQHPNIGWISEGRQNANEATSLIVDLGTPKMVDAVRLLPAKKPTSDLPSGFGFPRKLVVSVSDSAEPEKWTPVAERDMPNPGHNPVEIPFTETRARFVKVEATKLWKAFEKYPAFFALSEVEVLSDFKNLAVGKNLSSSGGMMNLIAQGGRSWTLAALSDGCGPDGLLVSVREWLGLLDQRLQLETRRHVLEGEAQNLLSGWRRTRLTGLAILGLTGALLIIVLPIRYRIHANHELTKVRERIAGDLHDEVGSNLGSIQMFADLAEGRSGPSDELKRIQRIAAETVSAVRDIVWLLRPQGDHRIGTVEHLRETSSIMLEALKWKFSANEEAWQFELSDEATRHLFLYFREALHNILRHAKASKVDIRVATRADRFQLVIADDGVGIDPERLMRKATLRALRQRVLALDADLQVDTAPGEGTRLTLTIPIDSKRLRKARRPQPAEENA